MIRRRLAAAALIALAGCSSTSPAASPITLRGSDNGSVNLAAGRYRFAWSGDCSTFFLEWAPTTSGAAIEIPAAMPSGEAVVTIPGGPAYVNRGGVCPGGYTVTITPAAGPS